MENKILVLVMGADLEIAPGYTFYDQFKYSANTWLSKKNRPSNIDVIYYEGGKYLETQYEVDEENDVGVLKIDCEDDLDGTFKKTWLTLNWIENNIKEKYDWVFRTNTSTFVNLHLLKEMIDNYFDKNNYKKLYASDLYSLSEANAPYPLCIYPRGNGILLSYKNVQKIILEGISLIYLRMTDDIAIGNCLNGYYIKQNIIDGQQGSTKDHFPYHTYIKGLTHGWYRCIDQKFNMGHQLSIWGDDNTNPDYWSKFVTIQLKMYRQRENEQSNFEKFITEIYPYLKDKKYKYEEIDNILHYSHNPSIFIGSIIGYIDYNEWKEKDLNELYLLEISHKASDDPQYEKYKEIQGKIL